MIATAADALDRLERLIADVPEPYEMTHTAARRLLTRATREAPASAALSVAIDEFHAHLHYMTLNMELYGRDQIDLAAYQDNCRAALRTVMAICRMVN